MICHRTYQVVDDQDVARGVAAVVEVPLEAARREEHAHLRRLVGRVEVLRVALRPRQAHPVTLGRLGSPAALPRLPAAVGLLLPLGHRPARARPLHPPVVLPAILPMPTAAAAASAAPASAPLLLLAVVVRGRLGIATPGVEPAPQVLVASAAVAT